MKIGKMGFGKGVLTFLVFQLALVGGLTFATQAQAAVGYDKSGYDKGAASWGTGNQSGYSEGDWVQYQYTVTGITTTIPDFNVVFDEQVAGKIFIDAFTNFRLIQDAPYIDANSVLANGVPRPPATNTGGWNSFTPGNINEKYITGSCGGLDPIDAPSAEHCFSVTGANLLAALGGSLGAGTHTVTIFFEAHMAPTFVWSSGNEDNLDQPGIYQVFAPSGVPDSTVYGTNVYNGWTTAAFTGAGGGGSNKHFTLADQSLGSKGAVTLPIPAVEVPNGSVTIIKNTQPDSGQDFNFTGSFGSFVLDDDADGTLPNSMTFSQLPMGTYNVAETSDPLYTTTSSCNNGSPTSAITVGAGEAVTCTFVNTLAVGRIVVEKQTLPNLSQQQFSFTGDIVATLGDGGGASTDGLLPGTYSVTESSLAGWDLTSIICDDNNSSGNISTGVATYQLEAGEIIKCIFTNTQRGHIIIVKNAINDSNQAFTFSNNFGNGNSPTFILTDDATPGTPSYNAEVLPGIYSVSEDAVAGWQQESMTCDDGSAVNAIMVAPGETVTCTFVNEEYAKIILIKNTIGGNGTFDFTMTGTGLAGSAQLVTVNETATQTFIDLDQDNTYSITETAQVGWDLTSAVCTGTNSPASITPNAGEEVTCTFTNTKRGSLQINKVVELNGYLFPETVDMDFTINVTGPSYPTGQAVVITVVNGVPTNSPVTLNNLIPGVYSVTETNPGIMWTVTGGGGATVSPGQTTSSTITNSVKIPSTIITLTPDVWETTEGGNVTLTITDTNNGAVPISNPSVELYANNALTVPQPTYVSGDTGNDGIMNVGEVWTWTWTGVISVNTVFMVNGIGQDPMQNPVNGPTYASETTSQTVRVVGTTRTIGFWQTHTTFTSSIFDNQLLGTLNVGTGGHIRTIDDYGKLFGGFYAPMAKKTTGQKRAAIDQARIQLLQQLLAAKLNCAAFGCSLVIQGQITNADSVYATGTKAQILAAASQMDAFNNSGDDNAIPTTLPVTGKATPKASQDTANTLFWDLP